MIHVCENKTLCSCKYNVIVFFNKKTITLYEDLCL